MIFSRSGFWLTCDTYDKQSSHWRKKLQFFHGRKTGGASLLSLSLGADVSLCSQKRWYCTCMTINAIDLWSLYLTIKCIVNLLHFVHSGIIIVGGINVRGSRGLTLSTNLLPYKRLTKSWIVLHCNATNHLPTTWRPHEPVYCWQSTNTGPYIQVRVIPQLKKSENVTSTRK